MQIKHVKVGKLFGMFDHSIPFNMGEHITIIHGSNGLGKTAILRMINGFFNKKYSELRTVPFKTFSITFDDDAKLTITKNVEKTDSDKKLEADLFFELEVPGEPLRGDTLGPPILPDEIGFPLRYLEEYIPGVSRVGSNSWIGISGEQLSFEEVIDTYGDFLPLHFVRESQLPLFEANRGEPAWVKDFRSRINVRLIETQRLVATTRTAKKRNHESVLTPAVSRFSNELAEIIKAKLGQYASLAQRLDQSFPMRVFNSDLASPLSAEQLKEKLASLQTKMDRLRAAGLLDKELGPYFNPNFPITDDSTKKNFLSVFADDVEQKLSVFGEVTEKIELLKHFVKGHFLDKELSVNKERGFVLTSTRTSEELSPTQLSSGEQHELVLFYELLFRLKENSLILIDEPEISLHPDWQLQFLDDLQSIIKLSSFDALIATHSPLIVGQQWELAVELTSHGKINLD